MGDNSQWEGGLKGAAGGALAGSAFGPIGTGVGALIGGIGGYFGSGESDQQAKARQMLTDYYNQVGSRQAPQLGQAAQGSYSDFRGNQSDLINRLTATSRGQGPSVAMAQMKAAQDRNQAAQSSFANSGRGGPLAAQQAMNNTALLGAQSAQTGVAARLQEQQNANQLLGNVIGQGRGQDEAMNQYNAGAQNDFAMANLKARLDQMGLDDRTKLQILSQLQGQNQQVAQTPSLGDQIMAGGAGMYSMGMSNKAGQRAGGTA